MYTHNNITIFVKGKDEIYAFLRKTTIKIKYLRKNLYYQAYMGTF